VMGVAESEPYVVVPRRTADDGLHVGSAGARTHPGFGIEALAERDCVAGDALGAVDLVMVRRRVVTRELGSGGEADATAHGGDEVTGLAIEHRAVENGPGDRGVFAVIAALDEER